MLSALEYHADNFVASNVGNNETLVDTGAEDTLVYSNSQKCQWQ